jgi:NADH-quinone oxidoreductase subunit N
VALAMIGLLNSGVAAAYYLRLALAVAQRPEKLDAAIHPPSPRVGIAVGAALLLAVAATLGLGIVPGEVLRAAEAGAHTILAPPPETVPQPIPAATQPQP